MSDDDLSKLTFLIAEESRFKLSLIRQNLKAFGAVNILEAMDGADAFDILLNKNIDCVITDSGMAPVDGLTLVRQIRTGQGSPKPDMPVIMLVENPAVSTLMAARDSGATDVLTKPFSAQTLFDRIQHALKNSRNFVNTEAFIGPDRRRHKPGERNEEERRQP